MECGIALGSNTGDRRGNITAGLHQMAALGHITALSPLYETEPVDCPEGSGAFFNGVAVFQWSSTAEALLVALRKIEVSLGRPAIRPWHAPRPLDLDILYAGDLTCHTATLTLPHPRLAERRFVLQPLADIRPELLLPGMDHTVSALLQRCPGSPLPVACLIHLRPFTR